MPGIDEFSVSGPSSPPSSAVNMALSAENALFRKYEIGKLLGCGAFAKVYHARDISNGRSVAVKVVSKSKLNNNVNLMAIMSRLRHPYIVKLFEVLATRTKIYFVLEFVRGGELFVKVAKGRFSEDLGRKYFQHLISAVSYCHLRGVFHRDLKPENLLLDNLMSMYKKIYKGEFRIPKWMSPDLKRFLTRILDTNPESRITTDEIKSDPWFRKGYSDIKSERSEDFSVALVVKEVVRLTHMEQFVENYLWRQTGRKRRAQKVGGRKKI